MTSQLSDSSVVPARAHASPPPSKHGRRTAQIEPDDLIQQGRTKVLTELPTMNAKIDQAGGAPRPIIESWTPWFESLTSIVIDPRRTITPEQAFALVQIADFPIGSIERHAQRAGEDPGNAKNTVPDIDIALVMLARAAGLPAPRGGVATYWLKNDAHEPLLFTGMTGEAAFTRAVININRLQAYGYALLHPICVGALLVTSPDGLARMHDAASNAVAVREALLELWRKNDDGDRLLSVEVFTCLLRTYLTPYPVGGVMYGGPNAANIPGQMQHDLAVGVLAPFYRERIIAERLVYLDAKDCADVVAALSHPSVLDRVLETLMLTKTEVTTYSKEMLAARLETRAEAIPAIRAFIELARWCGRTWGTHLSQINTYLKRADREVPEARLRDLPVAPSEGTGGHTHDQTERLMRMRHDDAIVRALDQALQCLTDQKESAA